MDFIAGSHYWTVKKIPMEERLQKILAQAGVASRRKCEQLIVDGRVMVNGRVVTQLGVKANPQKDRIEVDGKPIRKERHVYLLLFKPRGVVTTVSDPEGRKTVIDLIGHRKERIYPVGRLDFDTSGLLLLTNDGTLTHALLHPSRKIDKTYRAKVEGFVSDETVRRLAEGVLLEDGMTAPARVRRLDRANGCTWLEITIHEGRNRQVRRMCEAVGHPVRELRRIRFAFLTLGNLKPGEYRHLTQDEVRELMRLAGRNVRCE
jgi:23S rRNA pseudouridine2605 synthase